MKIIAAYDGSKYGRWAIQWVEHLPLRDPSVLIVVHVEDPRWVQSATLAHPDAVRNRRSKQEEIRRFDNFTERILCKARKLSAVVNIGGKVIKDRGPISNKLLEYAPKRNGMMVLGSRGLNAFGRFMLGSVSTRVAQYAPCPVLVVKQPPRTIKRILLAIDRYSSSTKALNFLITRMAPSSVANATWPIEVVVVYALPIDYSRENRTPLQRDKGLHVEIGAQKLKKAGFQVTTKMEMSDPAATILRIAAEQKPDLIVTGSKGVGAIERVFIGSVSYQVLQNASCSVLIIK